MNEPQNIEHLLVLEDQGGKRTIVLESATCSIGRTSNNSIVLDSPDISRHHAILLRLTKPETSHHTFRLIDGDLQGKRSKNGISVNGCSCFSHDLQHGDEIRFGKDVRARYYITANRSDIEFLNSCEDEEVSGFLSTLNSPFITLSASEDIDKYSTETTLERLASFPELISNPIIEIDFAGNITYLNPAAVSQFPNLRQQGLQHPILTGIISLAQNSQQSHCVREIAVGEQVFEQSIHCIVVSELIRSYLSEITKRKQVEALLKQSHEELELRVQQRTAELASINISLKDEIAERKRTENALQGSMATNRALLNAIPDWMFRITREGTLINFKAGKSAEVPLLTRKFLEKNLQEVLPSEIAQSMMNCIKEAFLTEQLQILEYQLNRDNCPKDYEVRIAITSENEVMAIVRDITERKRVEQDIRNALETEKQLNELKTRFVTMASHEFRTPLTSILSSAELLEHYAHKLDDNKKITHLQRIQTAVKHMTGLLNDVLLLGKAEAGKIELTPTPLSLAQYCRDLVEEMQLTTSTHTIVFCPQDQYSIACLDKQLLRHILTNLLSNSIKYSPKNTLVQFDLICESERAIFRIQDQGIGIPETEQERLFSSFYRASNVGSISGTGLGLSIVKKAVDLHGGEITLESRVGIGTTFTVMLPYSTCQTSQVDISATSCPLSLLN